MIDLNCDLGEGGPDDVLIPLCGRVNIATGGHAGDDASMRAAIALAMTHGVRIGAHPAYADRAGFGRRELHQPAAEIAASLADQLARFAAIAGELGAAIDHVKPHGALYHRAGHDAEVARAIVDAMPAGVAVVGQPGTAIAVVCAARGVRFLGEFFADRRYEADGTLTPRTRDDAVLHEPAEAIEQVNTMLRERVVIARSGQRVPTGEITTVCVHGDGVAAVPMLRALAAIVAPDEFARRR